jgi:hypothetical protein
MQLYRPVLAALDHDEVLDLHVVSLDLLTDVARDLLGRGHVLIGDGNQIAHFAPSSCIWGGGKLPDRRMPR